MENDYNCKYVSTVKVLTSTFGKPILNICVFDSVNVISLPYVFGFSFLVFNPLVPLIIHSARHIMFK